MTRAFASNTIFVLKTIPTLKFEQTSGGALSMKPSGIENELRDKT